MRINKFLASCGVASRRKCDEIVLSGRVCVNGKRVSSVGLDINEKRDEVTLDGQKLTLPSEFVYLKLNKPKGYACTAHDEKGRKTIFDLVQSDVRLVNVGRLDYNTEGLIFLTNDGEFANLVMHPKFHFEKEYHVTIEGKILESELAVLRAGVVENGVKMPKARVKVLSVDEKTTKLSVVIFEGQNHQIRRMFQCIGKQIVLLKRVRVGQVTLGGLSRGKTKPMTAEEIASFR